MHYNIWNHRNFFVNLSTIKINRALSGTWLGTHRLLLLVSALWSCCSHSQRLIFKRSLRPLLLRTSIASLLLRNWFHYWPFEQLRTPQDSNRPMWGILHNGLNISLLYLPSSLLWQRPLITLNLCKRIKVSSHALSEWRLVVLLVNISLLSRTSTWLLKRLHVWQFNV